MRKTTEAVLFLNEHLPPLRVLARRFGVRRLYAYGSVLTNRFQPDSDVDLLVEFDETGLQPEEIGQRYWDLLDALEALLDRPVDLQRNRVFRNPYFRDEVERTKRLLIEYPVLSTSACAPSAKADGNAGQVPPGLKTSFEI